MNKEHLTYFKVENFKRFDSLELTDIGQFNLIVGDNNVGKTSLLEALSILNGVNNQYPKSEMARNMSFALCRRGVEVSNNNSLFFKYLAKKQDTKIALNFTFEDNEVTELAFQKSSWDQIDVVLGKKILGIDNEDRSGQNNQPIVKSNQNPSLVPACFETGENLVVEYQGVLNHSMPNKRSLINNLKVIDNHIVEIEVLPIQDKQHVMIGFDNSDLYMPVTGMGESAIRVFYYLLQIIRRANKMLMIDEIDTGIHFTRLKAFLKNIINIAINNNVQLFITTHSLECQQAFAELFEDVDMQQHQSKVRQFTLIENESEQIVASVRDWEQLESSLETGYDTRGGKRGW